ncbi:MAG: hypothetical protein R2751_01965 [Bacteroidales bacterium]
MIENAIEDGKVTRAELDQIMALATEDSHIDAQEQALLYQIQEMIGQQNRQGRSLTMRPS